MERVVSALNRAANSNAVVNSCLGVVFCGLEAENEVLKKNNKQIKNTIWEWKQTLYAEASATPQKALVPLSALQAIYGDVVTPVSSSGGDDKQEAKPSKTQFMVWKKLDFKFPLTVSCIHFISSTIGAYLVIKVLKLKPLIQVDPEDRWRRIFPMSFIFCINIVLGNVSLRYIPVSFMQTIKSFTPATTVILQWLIWKKYFDLRIWASLVPIVGGILVSSITELSFNMLGFCAALFGCVATSTKTILAESLLHGYKFDSGTSHIPQQLQLHNAVEGKWETYQNRFFIAPSISCFAIR